MDVSAMYTQVSLHSVCANRKILEHHAQPPRFLIFIFLVLQLALIATVTVSPAVTIAIIGIILSFILFAAHLSKCSVDGLLDIE